MAKYPDQAAWDQPQPHLQRKRTAKFDFRSYLALNPDLDGKVKFNARDAYLHWVTRGMKENRPYICSTDPTKWDVEAAQKKFPNVRTLKDLWYRSIRSTLPASDKYYLFELAPYKNSGLNNQIYGILNGLILCWMSKRKMVVTGYYPHFSIDKSSHLGELLDLEWMNTYLDKYGLKIMDIRDLKIPQQQWKQSRCPNVLCSDYAVQQQSGYLERLKQDMAKDTDTYIIQGSALHVNVAILQQPPQDEIRKMFRDIALNIRFSQWIRDEATRIQAEIGLGSRYLCVHFRFEDDMVDALYRKRRDRFPRDADVDRQVQIVYERYRQKIKDLQRLVGDLPIYLCTGLAVGNNKYSYLLADLKKEFPKVVWKNKGLGKGREIDAAVDLILAQGCSGFVGFGFSSFSWIVQLVFGGTSVVVPEY